MEKQFETNIHSIMRSNGFYRFDRFIIEEMGFDIEGLEENEIKELRHQALLEFRKKTGRNNIATLPTIRRWFGTNSYRRPSREQVYKICFALGADREKTSEYLTVGLGEPCFQINDYSEMIFLYGIDNKLTYEDCEQMIAMFEESMGEDISFDGIHPTDEMWSLYEAKMNLPKEKFMQWMISHAEWFRGYSCTMLRYVKTIKSKIVKEIKYDSSKRLEDLLKEAGYYAWRKVHNDDKSERIMIQNFVKSYKGSKFYKVSESLGQNILELCNIVYETRETNRKVLDTIYSPVKRTWKQKRINPDEPLYVMGEKYMSDLLRVPMWKEKMINCQRALRILSKINENNKTPDWILNLCKDLQGDCNMMFDTVSGAKHIINEYMRENQRRCILLQRNDLMPMILYLAQSKYVHEHPNEYKKDEAKIAFVTLADTVLTACYMEPFNEKYELDALLSTCFQEDEMYSYSDLLDVYFERERSE